MEMKKAYCFDCEQELPQVKPTDTVYMVFVQDAPSDKNIAFFCEKCAGERGIRGIPPEEWAEAEGLIQ